VESIFVMASKGRPSSKFSFDVTKPIKMGFLNKQGKSAVGSGDASS